uniref:RNase H type-1 domain-containing protein n=1 Tax=Lotus japonicus TaxID=34305 RepID=I3SNJ7_LOTJA|nr:unknown [Lotus japonicus]
MVGTIRINYDASFKCASFGLNARHELGQVIAAVTNFSREATSPLLVECLCFRWTLCLANGLGFRHILMENDYLMLHTIKLGRQS